MATVVTPSTTTRGPSVVQDAADQLDALDIKIRRSKHQKQQKQAELQEVRDVFYHAESLEEREQKEKDKAALESAGSSITNSTDSSTTTSTTTDTTKQTEASLVSALEPQANGATATTATTRPRYVAAKDFELLKVIGMGAFGKVLQVRNKKSKNILAMKVISKRLLRRKAGYIENVQAERNILTKVRHPFVVTMHCSFQSREKLFIIMDFLAGGELFLRLGREGIFLEKTAAFYLAEIILALDHLHHHGVLHRDLKPENILLGSVSVDCLVYCIVSFVVGVLLEG
jgi:serine/threonine protein kinase